MKKLSYYYWLIVLNLCSIAHVFAANHLVTELDHSVRTDAGYHRFSTFDGLDTFGALLNIRNTDVVLPGNGPTITIGRSYQRTIDSNGYQYQWHWHYGPRIYQINTRVGPGNPNGTFVLELPDGTRQGFYRYDMPGDIHYMNAQKWDLTFQADRRSMLLYDNNGNRYRFVLTFNGKGQYYDIDRIIDKHGNWIQYHYVAEPDEFSRVVTHASDGAPILSPNHHVYLTGISGSDGRYVRLDHISYFKGLLFPEAITTSSGVWRYRYMPVYVVAEGKRSITNYALQEQTLPDGSRWQYDYETPVLGDFYAALRTPLLNQVVTPAGGTVRYQYHITNNTTGSGAKWVSLKQRQSFDNQGRALGTETIAMIQPGFADYRITGPDVITEYYHNNTIAHQQLHLYSTARMKKIIARATGKELQSTSYEWAGFIISPVRSYLGTKSDHYTRMPVLKTQTIEQDGQTFKKEYEYSDENYYAHPLKLTETGPAGTRVWDYSYYNNPKPALQHVDGQLQTVKLDGKVQLHRVFAANDNLISETRLGITKTYSYYPVTECQAADTYCFSGALQSVTDAKNHTVTYSQYYRGQPEHEVHPESVVIQRKINPDGTVKSMTNGNGFTTHYEYDGLQRPIKVTPPHGYPTEIDYYPDNGSITTTRHHYQEVRTEDGFGRLLSQEQRDLNSGIRYYQQHRYDFAGNRLFSSFVSEEPNNADALGVYQQYDGLGRVIRSHFPYASHTDNRVTRYEYTDGQVTVTNPRGQQTLKQLVGYGAPDQQTVQLQVVLKKRLI